MLDINKIYEGGRVDVFLQRSLVCKWGKISKKKTLLKEVNV